MTTDKSAVRNFYIRYILILEYLTVLQQSPDLREKKSRQDMMSKREYRENIATHALAAKLLMKDESTTLEVVS